MIALTGKYTSATIYTDLADNGVIGQIQALCNQESLKDCKIAVMPDCHVGKGCTIGTTIEVKDKVVPNLVGVDIGCGMLTVKLKEKRLDLPKFDSNLKKIIPSGFNIRDSEHKLTKNINLEQLKCSKYINKNRALLSLGTLGGGNHFIEIAKNSENEVYLIIHTGSRHLGKQVADYYQNKAYESLVNSRYEDNVQEIISRLKEQGRAREIESTVKNLKKEKVSKELAYCEGELLQDYLHDVRICQEYAKLNRQIIAEELLKTSKLHSVDQFETVHNYIDLSRNILRKGAVSAQEGEKLLIPINQLDGSLICIGKGNPDYNYSAPHGAGRICSRSEAKNRFIVSDYAKRMEEAEIFSTTVNKSTLDECPMVYKSIEDIEPFISDTVTIVERLKPIYNFKAGE